MGVGNAWFSKYGLFFSKMESGRLLFGHELLNLGFHGFDFLLLGCAVCFYLGQFLTQFHDNAVCFVLCIGLGRIALADLEGNAGVEHVVVIAQSRADADEGGCIRMVERTESYGIGRAIVAVPYREVPFIFRIELSRMEGCQSSRTGAYFIDAVAEAIDAFAQVVELPAVDGIFGARSNVAVFDVRNGRVVHVHTIIIDGRPIVDGDGVDFDIFVQADSQVTARGSGSDILIVPFDTEFAIFAEDGGIATVVSKFRFDDGSCALGRSGCGSTRCCTAGTGIRFCRSIKGNGVGTGVFEEGVDGVGCAVGASALVQADAVTGDEVNRGTLQLCYVDSVC